MPIDEFAAAAHAEGAGRGQAHQDVVAEQTAVGPSLFEGELEAILERALSNPGLGLVYEEAKLDVPVYRLLMSRTRHHVFNAVHGDELVVLSVWGSVKERGPKL